MPKNHRIEARVDQDTKEALERKAALFGGMTQFLENLARFDIVILDSNASRLVNFMEKQNLKRSG